MDAAWPSIVLLWERGQPALDSLAHHLPPIIYLWFRLPTPHLTSSQQSTSGLFPPLGVCLLLASRPCPHSLFYINRAYQSQFIHPSPHTYNTPTLQPAVPSSSSPTHCTRPYLLRECKRCRLIFSPSNLGPLTNHRGTDPASVRTSLGPKRQQPKVRLPLRPPEPFPPLAVPCLYPKKTPSFSISSRITNKCCLAVTWLGFFVPFAPSVDFLPVLCFHPAVISAHCCLCILPPSSNAKHLGPVNTRHQTALSLILLPSFRVTARSTPCSCYPQARRCLQVRYLLVLCLAHASTIPFRFFGRSPFFLRL